MEENNDLFELSNKHRLRIIELVLERPHRHTDLLKELKIAPAEVTRHLRRLVGSKLLEKGTDSRYKATVYGKLLFRQLKNLDLLCMNRKFFDTHDLSVIPEELSSLNILTRAELVKGTMEVIGSIYQITENADVFVWSMFQAPADPFIMEHKHQLTRGLDLRLMFREGARIPVEYSDNRSLPLEIRILTNIPLGLGMSDKRGIVVLPDTSGIIDYRYAITGAEPSFLRWCSLLFEHHWEAGDDLRL